MGIHLFIATPCYGGVVGQGYMQSVCGLMAAAPELGLELTLGLLGQDALVTRSRNTLLSQFMSISTATHILFVDADISFTVDNVARLFNSGKSVVAGIYPLKAFYWDGSFGRHVVAGEQSDSAGLHYVGSLETDDKIIWESDFATARYAGTGFMLITREAVAQMQEAYPETSYTETDAYTSSGFRPPMSFALFDCMIDRESGRYMSEDFTFCYRWQKIGGLVWLDTQAELVHTGPSDFRGRPARRFKRPRP